MKKKQITSLSMILLIASIFSVVAFTQPDKRQNNKNDQPGKSKGQDIKQSPGNSGKDKDRFQPNGNSNNNNGNPGKNDKVFKNQNGNKSKDKNDNKGNNKGLKGHNGKNEKAVDFNWDRESFKDRKKIKNQDKVSICHKFNGNEPAVNIRVSKNAMNAHLAHGDVIGSCPAITDKRYSDIFLNRRNEYYNRLQDSQEQVLYSRSILDYALSRLATSRSQLAVMQQNNMALADIQRKQQTVAELEQNTTLLQSLIGVAAELVVNKLQ